MFKQVVDNTRHQSIKLKQEHGESEINFLDTTVFFENEKDCKRLWTRAHFKPTDTHALLHKLSHHPPHTFQGIVKSQILRFYRIYSREAAAILFRKQRKNYSV